MSVQRGRFSAAVGITLIGNAIPPIFALATAPLLAQGLGVQGRGQVAAAQSVSLLAVSALAFGLPEALTHYVAQGLLLTKCRLLFTAVMMALIGVSAVVILSQLSDWLGAGDEATAELIRLGAWSIGPMLIVSLIRGVSAGQGRWGLVALERSVGSVARLVLLAMLMLLGHFNEVSATIVVVFTPVLGGLVYLWTLRRSSTSPEFSSEAVTQRRLVVYGGTIWIGSISGILLMRVDQAILVPLAGPLELGLYAVAVAISEVPLVLNSAIRDVAFARHSAGFDAASLSRAARLSGLLSAVSALGIAILLPWGVPALFGTDFAGAIPVCALLLVAVAVGTPGSVAGAGLSAIGRPGRRSISLTIACVVNVVLLVVLAPVWGAVGAAVATLFGNLVSSNLNVWWLNREAGTTWNDFYRLRGSDMAALTDIVGRWRDATASAMRK